MWASAQENVVEATLRLVRDRWALATLFDAYFGFLWFVIWIFATERRGWTKWAWFVAILLFGNLAMATFVLARLARTPKEEGLRGFLLGAG